MSGPETDPCGRARVNSSTRAGSTRATDPRHRPRPGDEYLRCRPDARPRPVRPGRCHATHRDRAAELPADLDRFDDVRPRLGDDDADRLDLIDARIGGVERARDLVEPDFAFKARLERAPQADVIDWGLGWQREPDYRNNLTKTRKPSDTMCAVHAPRRQTLPPNPRTDQRSRSRCGRWRSAIDHRTPSLTSGA